MKITDPITQQKYNALSKRQRKIVNKAGVKNIGSWEMFHMIQKVCEVPFDQVPIKLNRCKNFVTSGGTNGKLQEEISRNILLARLDLGT